MSIVGDMIAYSRPLAAAAVVACSTLSLTVPARAYDMNSCTRLLDTFAIQQFTISGGGADFGDDPHLAGVPLGTAAVCWSPGGRVGLIGKLFADDPCLPFRPCTPLTAIAQIRFRRANGQFFNAGTFRILSQQDLAEKELKLVSPPGTFTAVNIKLFTFQNTPLGSVGNVLVAERNFLR